MTLVMAYRSAKMRFLLLCCITSQTFLMGVTLGFGVHTSSLFKMENMVLWTVISKLNSINPCLVIILSFELPKKRIELAFIIATAPRGINFPDGIKTGKRHFTRA